MTGPRDHSAELGTSTDAALAARLARQAGALLLDLRATSRLHGRDLGRAGDTRSNALLLELLALARPGDAVLSEESADTAARRDADRVWIIDPLDGTREYSVPERPDWAVHVALWERGRPAPAITAAAVALPALAGLYVMGTTAGSVVDRARPVFLVSESGPPVFASAVAADFDAVLEPMGSAGAKTMAVVRGDADAYLHARGQWEWDSAAPVGVAISAGLHASRIDGSPLTYNGDHPYLPDLLICRSELAAPLLAAISRVAADAHHQ